MNIFNEFAEIIENALIAQGENGIARVTEKSDIISAEKKKKFSSRPS